MISQVLWHDVWGRAQEVATRLAERVPVTFLSQTPVNRMLEAAERWKPALSQGKIDVLCPMTVPGDYWSPAVRRMNARRTVRTLQRQGIVPSKTAVFINTPFLPEILESADWGAVVYDWHDDFAAFEWAPLNGRDLERRTLARVDAMTSGTRFLAHQKATPQMSVQFLQNGVRFTAYDQCDAPRPDDLPAAKHIAGFIGTLSHQLDLDLIEKAASLLPEVAFVFIGPNRAERTPKGDNIHLLGLRPHGELPAYVRAFDAGLIPYAVGPGSEAINPTKLLEYAAAGVPVVSTPLPDVQAMFSDIAAIGSDAEQFAAHIRAACNGDLAAMAEQAKERARATTWEALGDELWSIITEAWGRKRG